jgi:hypothetical protein
MNTFDSAPQESTSWSRYNFEPLPFKGIDNATSLSLTWQDFDQDPDGENIFLYRGLDNVDAKLIKGIESLPILYSSSGEQLPKLLDLNLTSEEKKRLAKEATEFLGGGSGLILHTTRQKELAQSLGARGVMITYKIPKNWLIKEENWPSLGNVGEAELDFFNGLPQEFVFEVKQFGPDIETIPTPPIIPGQKSDDVISSPDLPTPTNNNDFRII